MPPNSVAEGFQKTSCEVAMSITEPPAAEQTTLVRQGTQRLGRRGSLVFEAKHSSGVPLFRDLPCEDYNFMCDY
jgi:hypothetical protein